MTIHLAVKEWRIFINDNFNYAYTWSDVTTMRMIMDDRRVDHATTPLSDGYYNWYVQAVDHGWEHHPFFGYRWFWCGPFTAKHYP